MPRVDNVADEEVEEVEVEVEAVLESLDARCVAKTPGGERRRVWRNRCI